MKRYEIIIIGGGPAGLSAAISAYESGAKNILVIERNNELGGILNQCIHTGFGLHIFKEELTGPEYAHRMIEKVRGYGIECALNTMVLDINAGREVTVVSQNGVEKLTADALILAMGCRERPRGALNIPGDRPAGVFSAGTAQELVNLRGYKVGKEAVILGSGDIGLIMARRLTLEGCKVKLVAELMPFSGGLKRNIVQCLDDFDIPLRFNATVTRIVGKERLEGVYIANVDGNKQPIAETEEFIACDTLLLSVGLIPENELAKMAGVELSPITGGAVVDNNMRTNVAGIYSCGNVLHVHDLVDYVTLESYDAGRSAARYVLNKERTEPKRVPIVCGDGARYAVPQFIDVDNIAENGVELKFRVDNIYRNASVKVAFGGDVKISLKRRIVTPGEMEKVTLKPELFKENDAPEEIKVWIEK